MIKKSHEDSYSNLNETYEHKLCCTRTNEIRISFHFLSKLTLFSAPHSEGLRLEFESLNVSY